MEGAVEGVAMLGAVVVVSGILGALQVRHRRWVRAQGGSAVPRAFQGRPVPDAAWLANLRHASPDRARWHVVFGALSERGVLREVATGRDVGAVHWRRRDLDIEIAQQEGDGAGAWRLRSRPVAVPHTWCHRLEDARTGEACGDVELAVTPAPVWSRDAALPSWAWLEVDGVRRYATVSRHRVGWLTEVQVVVLRDDEDDVVAWLCNDVGGGADRTCRVHAEADLDPLWAMLLYGLHRGLGPVDLAT